MGSLANGGGRRLVTEHDEIHQLRKLLFAELAKRDRIYKIVMQDLRPLWRKASASRDDNRHFFELRAAADAPDATDSLRAYVAAVERVVTNTLRLTTDGKPVPWVGYYLHAHVEPRSRLRPDPRPRRPEDVRLAWIERAALEIHVSPHEMRAVLVGDDAAPIAEKRIDGHAGYSNVEWTELEEGAYALLDQHLGQMRKDYEEKNLGLKHEPDTLGAPPLHLKSRNPSRQESLPADMALLAAWLLGDSTPDKRTCDRLSDRVKLLGIDTPPRR